jgi:outer membrane biosynthesis protein TonB
MVTAMIKTTVNDDSLKNSIAVSGVLHLLALLLLYFGLPRLFTPLPSHHDPVPFEIVEIADLTNTSVKPQEEQKPPAPPPPKPETKPEQAQTPPPPKPPEPQVEALNPEPKPLPKPPPPKPAEKPQPDAFSKMLKNLEANKKVEAPKAQESKPDSKTPSQQAASAAPTLSTRLTISEEDALRRQISQCWNMPIGARDAQNLIVEVIINVNPDRTVQHAEVVDKSRMASDSFFRAAAEAALRALYSPQCTPLELPADKYDQWKTIDFTFDPRDML